MKKFCILASVLIFSASTTFAALKENESEVTFKTDIQSKHCKDRVEKVIPFEKGVEDMTIKIPEGVVYIKFRSDKTSVESLKKSIEAMGYSVELDKVPAKTHKITMQRVQGTDNQ